MDWKERFKEIYQILLFDFIFPNEVAKIEGVDQYSKEEMEALSFSLPNDENAQTLLARYCKEEKLILFPGPSSEMNLLEIRSLDSDQFHSSSNSWYEDQEFAKNDKVFPGWYVIKNTLSQPISWRDYKHSLSQIQRPPNIAELVWIMILYEKIRKRKMFSEDEEVVRTFSREDKENNWRVCVDNMSALGNCIDLYTCPDWLPTKTTYIQEINFLF